MNFIAHAGKLYARTFTLQIDDEETYLGSVWTDGEARIVFLEDEKDERQIDVIKRQNGLLACGHPFPIKPFSAFVARHGKPCTHCGTKASKIYKWRDALSMNTEVTVQKEKDQKHKRCKQCQITQYCSKACQKAHWKGGHRIHCKSLKALFEEAL